MELVKQLLISIGFLLIGLSNSYSQGDSTFILVTDKLENGEFLQLNFNSTGCFHFLTDSLSIHKWNDRYYLRYKNQTYIMDKESLMFFRDYEFKLNNLEKNVSYCTTTDFYTLTYNTEIYQYWDLGCSWQGYRKLVNFISEFDKSN